MLDLGASINVMPKSIYQSLHIGELKPMGMVIQLANRNTHLEGILEDVLVRVNDLIFPAYFYVLNMEDDMHASQPILILGRPFFKTAKTKIDIHSGTLSMEFGDSKVHFNLFDAMRYPPEEHSIFHLDIIDSLVDDVHENLLVKFPKIVGIRDEFRCSDCDGIHDLCAVCIKIAACLHGSNFVNSDATGLESVNFGSAKYDSVNYANLISGNADSTHSVLNSVDVNSDSVNSVSADLNSASLDSENPGSTNFNSTHFDSVCTMPVFLDSATLNYAILNFAFSVSACSNLAITFSDSVHSGFIPPVLNSVILDFAISDSVSIPINSCHFEISVHHATSTDFVDPMGYDDAIVQDFSQVAVLKLNQQD